MLFNYDPFAVNPESSLRRKKIIPLAVDDRLVLSTGPFHPSPRSCPWSEVPGFGQEVCVKVGVLRWIVIGDIVACDNRGGRDFRLQAVLGGPSAT